MGSTVRSGLTYEDLLAYPEESWPKRELFEGELVVSPSPAARHQSVLIRFGAALLPWAEATGAAVMAGFDLEIAERMGTYLCPDLIVILAHRIDLVGDRPGKAPPDMVVEISSPSTRSRDLVRKRDYYEQFGVPEYVLADLDMDRILLFELRDGRYGEPRVVGRGEVLESNHLKGFCAPVDWLLDITGSARA